MFALVFCFFTGLITFRLSHSLSLLKAKLPSKVSCCSPQICVQILFFLCAGNCFAFLVLFFFFCTGTNVEPQLRGHRYSIGRICGETSDTTGHEVSAASRDEMCI